MRRLSMRPKSSAVETENGGLHITIHPPGSSGSGESISPRPSASIMPPVTQYGTSEPTVNARARSCSAEKFAPVSTLSARSTAAASVLPPAMPAPTGTLFFMRMSAPRVLSPAASKNTRAARTARFRSSRGSHGIEHFASILPSRRRVTSTSSQSETLPMTMVRSW